MKRRFGPTGSRPLRQFRRGHRYLQWRAVLASRDPLRTPLLRSVAVEAKVHRQPIPAWAAALKTVAFHNERIRYTSMPFEYEDPLHPRMVALRRKYKLDAVVSGSASETEQLVKLRDWVSRQWKYQPPAVHYPAWDADEILRRKYGFCVQYAVVLMQTAISLGHQARFVFGDNPGGSYEGGHEVCEIWSNEHRKWIFMDGTVSLHYIDPKTKVPMSMLEVHDLLVKTYYQGRPATLANRPPQRQLSDAIAICFGSSMTPGALPAGSKAGVEARVEGGRYSLPTRWLSAKLPAQEQLLRPCVSAADDPRLRAGIGRNTGGGRTRRPPSNGFTTTSPPAATTWTGASTRSVSRPA